MNSPQSVATKANLKAYLADPEKFVHCLYLLEINAHHTESDTLVNELEDLFEVLADDIATVRNTKRAIKKYGREVCMALYKEYETSGNGSRTIGCGYGLTTMQTDAAINAGRYLAEHKG